jgi:carboxymethylenebutenolidase
MDSRKAARQHGPTEGEEAPLATIETPVLKSEGARTFDSYYARPENGRGPGLVILTEMWGVAASKREMAEEYAAKGWCALVPNLFWRSEFSGVVPFDQADVAWKRLQAFDFDKAAEDTKLAVDWLRDQPQCNGKVAAIGFCMGGRTAFLAAARAGVDAAVALYALGIAKHLDEMARVNCPTQLHYGLNDEHIPKSEIDMVDMASKANGKIEVHLHPGAGHGFFTAGRPAYNAEAVARANKEIDRLLAPLR